MAKETLYQAVIVWSKRDHFAIVCCTNGKEVFMAVMKKAPATASPLIILALVIVAAGLIYFLVR